MSTIPILCTKLQVPVPRPGMVRRPRLMARLREGLSRRLILVSAPAGYGKTTLLAHFASEVNLPLVWYTLDPSDNDPATFFSYLLAGISAQRPALGHTTRALLDDPRLFARTEQIAATLLGEFIATGVSLVIVLDDYHVITAPSIHSALDFLLANLPPQVHLVILTRSDPPLALARLRAQGQLLEIRTNDLRFTPAEVAQFLRQTADLELGDADAALLADRTEGWVAGLQLAAASLRRRNRSEWEEFIRTFGGATRPIFEYLADEVYASQPPDVQFFLTRTAILRDLSADLCDHVLEIDHSQAMLERVERANLFISPLDVGRTTYRYHALFREFLQRRLLEEAGRDAVRRLHRRAAAWFLERGDDEQAMEHLLAGEDYEAAADLVRPLYERLFRTSRYHLLESWLERFPPSIAQAAPWVLLARAGIALLRGDHRQAERLCRQAEPALQAQGDRAGLYTLHLHLAEVAQNRGDFAQSESAYRRALDYAVDEAQRAVALGRIARCLYIRGGDVDEALHLLDRAMELIAKEGRPLERARLFSIKGRILSALGDFDRALEAWRTACDLLEAEGNRHRQIGVLNNMAYHYYLLGRLEQAEETARRALELARTFNRQNQYAYALNVQGVVHQARGEWEAARRCHEEALTIFSRLDERYEIPVTLNYMGLLNRRAGHLEEALRWGREGLALREELGNDYETGLSLIDVGATYLELGRLDQAEKLWRRALDIFIRHQARYEQAQLHFYLAVLAHRRNETEALEAHLNTSLEMARRHGYDYIFIQEAAWAIPLLTPLALSGSPYAAQLLTRLGRPAVDALIPYLEEAEPDIRARAAALLGRLGEASALEALAAHRRDPSPAVRRAVEEAITAILSTPPPPLCVQTLGLTRIWRGGEEIVRWPRRSALAVFLLLLQSAPRPVAADALAEALWPGSPPDKASQSLRRAISDLRRTLEPELPAAFPSRYLKAEQETYALVLPPGSYVDDVVFEREMTAILAAPLPSTVGDSRKAIAELEKVLKRYTGDYSPTFPYEEWALNRREYLRHLLLRGAQRLARLYLETGQLEKAIAICRRILAQDPWDEEATRTMMEAYAALKDIPAALRVYEAYRDRLRRDLDLPPREDLTRLYEQLRRR